MSRPERIHVVGGHYLVIDEFRSKEVLVAAPNRNHTEAELHQLTAHRAQYEAQLRYATSRWCARVHTHCWLPACALLELQIGWAPLERVMRSLRGPFSHYLRKASGYSGNPYSGRYSAWLIEPAYTQDLRRDICWRPVRAGLCRNPTDYRYATAHFALNGPAPAFLARSELLAWLQRRQVHTGAQLIHFLSTEPRPQFTSLLNGSPYDRRIVGSKEFVQKAHRQETREPLTATSDAVIPWVHKLAHREIGSAIVSYDYSSSALTAALIAWLVSCSGTGSVSTVTDWLPTWSRSRLERAIDHYMQAVPNLFSHHTLHQFVLFLTRLSSRAIANDPGPSDHM